jgi:hypothetical protein
MYGMSMKLRIIAMSSGPCHPAVDSWQVPFGGSLPPLTIPWAMGAHANTEPPSVPMPPSPNSESPSFPAHSKPPVITEMGVQQHGSGFLHEGEVGNFVQHTRASQSLDEDLGALTMSLRLRLRTTGMPKLISAITMSC